MALSPDYVRNNYQRIMGVDSLENLPDNRYAQQLYEMVSGQLSASPAYRNALLDDPRLGQTLAGEQGPGAEQTLKALASANNTDHCRRFLDNPSTQVSPHDLNEAMTEAMQAGQHQTVSLLLKRGANRNSLSKEQQQEVVTHTGDHSFLEDTAHLRSGELAQRSLDTETVARMGTKLAENGADPTGVTAIADELGQGISESGQHYQLALQQQAGEAIDNAAQQSLETQKNMQHLYEEMDPTVDPYANS